MTTSPSTRRPVLVLAAWDPELTRLRDLLAGSRRRPPVALATVGVGLVEAAVGTLAAIEKERPTRVILVGTAGAYPHAAARLRIGTVVEAREVRLASLSAARGQAYIPAPLPTSHRLPGVPRPRARASRRPRVVVACPIGITRSRAAAESLASATAAHVENLEAFAVARAAAAAGVPLTVFLGVSNEVGPNAHAAWKRHAGAAAAAACQAAYEAVTRVGGGGLRPP